MARQVLCEEPRIVRNPLLPELLCRYKTYYFGNRLCYWHGRNSDTNFPYHLFSVPTKKVWIDEEKGLFKRIPAIGHDDLENYYIFDENTGETFPIFIEVPCGHCSACQVQKQNSFVQRCKLESLTHLSMPFFVTLTYDNEHLPYAEIDGKKYATLSVRDVQLFLKRFRINLERKYNQTEPIRYSVVGEYGKNTHRPHYHLLIWNINAFREHEYYKVFCIMNDSWKKGYIKYRVVDMKDEGKTFRYTTKYCRKDISPHVPNHIWNNPLFRKSVRCSSNRHGGIGKPFLKSHAEELRKGRKNAMYFDFFNGSVDNLYFNSYVLNTLYPSYSRLVPAFYRNACKELAYYNDGTHNLLLTKLREESPCYISKQPPLNIKKPHYKSAEECLEVINKWHHHKDYVSPHTARMKQIEREFFLCNLFQNIPEKDIKAFIYRSKQMIQRQYSLELL